MKRTLITIALLAVVAASAASIAQAQGELTLDSLAGQLQSLTRGLSSHNERIAAIETAIAPTATAQKETQNETDELFEMIDRIFRVLMHQKEAPRETIYLAFLLALNDYEGIGGTTRPVGSYFRLPEEDQQRRLSLYYDYFIQAADICDLEYDRAFQLFNRWANQLELGGFRAELGSRLREEVPGGGARLDFIWRIATQKLIQDHFIAAWNIEGIKGSGCEFYLIWYTKPVLGK